MVHLVPKEMQETLVKTEVMEQLEQLVHVGQLGQQVVRV
jgi:hypothetical protein